MHAVLAAFPRRPLTLRPPHGLFGILGWTLGMALFAAGLGAWLGIAVVPGILSDHAIRDAAVPLANARILEGRCSARLGLFQDCRATLAVPLKQGEVRREVEALFVAPHLGPWTARVMADPQRPELATTDIALERLWNRVATAAGVAVVGLVLLVGGWLMGRDRMRARRRVKALSGQVLEPVPLALFGTARGTWSLGDAEGRRFQVSVPERARPFVLDAARGLVLGVTAPGAVHPLPLDERLRWVDLTEAERAALQQARG